MSIHSTDPTSQSEYPTLVQYLGSDQAVRKAIREADRRERDHARQWGSVVDASYVTQKPPITYEDVVQIVREVIREEARR
jgi:hypothetical protein